MNKLELFEKMAHDTFECGGGGEDKINMQHALKKKTARERIYSLLDQGTFIEIGGFIGGKSSGVVTGYGTVNGRLVYVCAEDYTLEGGTFNELGSKKITELIDMAMQMGAPVVQIFDSVGVKIDESVNILGLYGNVLKRNGKGSGVIPQISVICGPCNGMSALRASMSDFVITVNEASEYSVNTPGELTKAEEKYVSNKEVGAGTSANVIGNAEFNADTEEDAFNIARNILEYLPSNNTEAPWIGEGDADLNSAKKELNEKALQDSCSMNDIIVDLADGGNALEINKEFKCAIGTYFIKLNGMSIGVIACNEEVNKLTSLAAIKVSSFVRLCDSFNIPVLSLVDCEGFKTSLSEEQQGLATAAGKLMYSLIDATVPKISLITGKAYGAAYMVLASKESAFDMTIAWPNAKICITDPKAVILAAHREEALASENPKKAEEELVAKYMDETVNPYKAAECGLLSDIIKPEETKQRLVSMFDMLQSKRELNYPKKHGSMQSH